MSWCRPKRPLSLACTGVIQRLLCRVKPRSLEVTARARSILRQGPDRLTFDVVADALAACVGVGWGREMASVLHGTPRSAAALQSARRLVVGRKTVLQSHSALLVFGIAVAPRARVLF
jgi:hypothetical protein